jgi:hypothetical protein
MFAIKEEGSSRRKAMQDVYLLDSFMAAYMYKPDPLIKYLAPVKEGYAQETLNVTLEVRAGIPEHRSGKEQTPHEALNIAMGNN